MVAVEDRAGAPALGRRQPDGQRAVESASVLWLDPLGGSLPQVRAASLLCGGGRVERIVSRRYPVFHSRAAGGSVPLQWGYCADRSGGSRELFSGPCIGVRPITS